MLPELGQLLAGSCFEPEIHNKLLKLWASLLTYSHGEREGYLSRGIDYRKNYYVAHLKHSKN